jgi:hypothetical protein
MQGMAAAMVHGIGDHAAVGKAGLQPPAIEAPAFKIPIGEKVHAHSRIGSNHQLHVIEINILKEAIGKRRSNEIDEDTFTVWQEHFCASAGVRSMMGTANTMGCFLEATGLAPFGSATMLSFDAAKARQVEVLSLMVKHGAITQAQADEARAEKINLHASRFDITAPHFVLGPVAQEITQRFGERALYEGGLEVTTTLDARLQKIAEDAIEANVAANEKATRLMVEQDKGTVDSMVDSLGSWAGIHVLDMLGLPSITRWIGQALSDYNTEVDNFWNMMGLDEEKRDAIDDFFVDGALYASTGMTQADFKRMVDSEDNNIFWPDQNVLNDIIQQIGRFSAAVSIMP